MPMIAWRASSRLYRSMTSMLTVGGHQDHLIERGVVIGRDQFVLTDEPDSGRLGQLGDTQNACGVEDPGAGRQHDGRGFEELHEQVETASASSCGLAAVDSITRMS